MKQKHISLFVLTLVLSSIFTVTSAYAFSFDDDSVIEQLTENDGSGQYSILDSLNLNIEKNTTVYVIIGAFVLGVIAIVFINFCS